MMRVALLLLICVLLHGCHYQSPGNAGGQPQVFSSGEDTYLLQHGQVYRMTVNDNGSVSWTAVGRVPD